MNSNSQTVTIISTGETFTSSDREKIHQFICEKTGEKEPRTTYVQETNTLYIHKGESEIPFAKVF